MGFGDGLGRDAELQAAYADRATVKARRMASIYRTRRPGYHDTRKWRATTLPDAVLAVGARMAASRYVSPTSLALIKPDVLPTMRRSVVPRRTSIQPPLQQKRCASPRRLPWRCSR